MVDIKEIKHIRATPFTLMSSAIHGILALILAIIVVLAFGIVAAFIPALSMVAGVIALVGVAIIILWPLTAFFINILYAFVFAGLYNLLVPRVGGIKLGLKGNELRSLPVVSFALIMACISTIFAFILGLYLAGGFGPLFALISTLIPVVANTIATATNTTGEPVATGAIVGTAGLVLSLIFIIVVPIIVFISSFIGNALFAIFYNVVIPKVGGARLDFAPVSGNVHELTAVSPLPTALALSVVFTIFSLLQSLLDLFSYSMAGNAAGGVLNLIANVIGTFIMAYILVALISIVYNVLQPKVGGIKLELE
jgi:hypothetical protein